MQFSRFPTWKTLPCRPGQDPAGSGQCILCHPAGKTLGLWGESGGKTTVGRTLLRIYEPDGGTIVFDGQDISKVTRAQAKALTRKMQMIFQDPYASLNPFFTVGEIIAVRARAA